MIRFRSRLLVRNVSFALLLTGLGRNATDVLPRRQIPQAPSRLRPAKPPAGEDPENVFSYLSQPGDVEVAMTGQMVRDFVKGSSPEGLWIFFDLLVLPRRRPIDGSSKRHVTVRGYRLAAPPFDRRMEETILFKGIGKISEVGPYTRELLISPRRCAFSAVNFNLM